MMCNYFSVVILINLVTVTIVSSRAVNISNSWMLPQEGFSVFYRYFRDRITWYEADAVCEFHHAHLVTADNTFQYDAIRAYLKELDISENIWIGLSKPVDRPNFTWRDYQTLKEDDHWQQEIPKENEAICVSMDPSSDYLWSPRTCGGPEVASFICELPVPSWALGAKGCLLTELPSLTVLYIPEDVALEMTSDCGLDGTKRIICKGNANREEILKQLTCALPSDEFEEKSTKSVTTNLVSSVPPEVFSEDLQNMLRTTKMWSLNTIRADYAMATRHRRETDNTLSPTSTKSTTDATSNKEVKATIDATVNTINLSTDSTMMETSSSTSDETTSKSETDLGFEQTTETPLIKNKSTDEVQSSDKFAAAIIGQGELFDITENGTALDESNDNETRPEKEFSFEIQMPNSNFIVNSTNETHSTDIYFKETLNDMNFTNLSSTQQLLNMRINATLSSLATKDLSDLINATTELYQKDNTTEFGAYNNNISTVETELEEKTAKPERNSNLQNILLEDDVINNAATEVDYNEINTDASDRFILKKKFLPKSLIAKSSTKTEASVSTYSALEEEPPTQPRPNRQRQLTRPQRRSFYPYFFSRVLG